MYSVLQGFKGFKAASSPARASRCSEHSLCKAGAYSLHSGPQGAAGRAQCGGGLLFESKASGLVAEMRRYKNQRVTTFLRHRDFRCKKNRKPKMLIFSAFCEGTESRLDFRRKKRLKIAEKVQEKAKISNKVAKKL